MSEEGGAEQRAIDTVRLLNISIIPVKEVGGLSEVMASAAFLFGMGLLHLLLQVFDAGCVLCGSKVRWSDNPGFRMTNLSHYWNPNFKNS